MTEHARLRLVAGTLRVLAATLGTLPVAVLASVCLARFLPLVEATRFALGLTLAIPLWVAAMCYVFLARSGWRACCACIAGALALGAIAYGVPP